MRLLGRQGNSVQLRVGAPFFFIRKRRSRASAQAGFISYGELAITYVIRSRRLWRVGASGIAFFAFVGRWIWYEEAWRGVENSGAQTLL
jgi:hypothetical protein